MSKGVAVLVVAALSGVALVPELRGQEAVPLVLTELGAPCVELAVVVDEVTVEHSCYDGQWDTVALRLAPGEHHFELFAPGFEPARVVLTVAREGGVRDPTLVPRLVRQPAIHVTLIPQEARLRVDGVEMAFPDRGVGVFPVSRGAHEVVAEAPGRRPRRERVNLNSSGQVVHLRLELEPVTGPLWSSIALAVAVAGIVAAAVLVARQRRRRRHAARPPVKPIVKSAFEPVRSTEPREQPEVEPLTTPAGRHRVVELFGPFHVYHTLGVGGIASVCVAVDSRNGRRVALKRMRRELLQDSDLVRRFVLEGDILQLLNRKYPEAGFVQVYDYGVQDLDSVQTPFVALELLEGFNLESTVRKQARLSPALALRVVRDTAAALACAHAEGICHRDLSPDNIMIVHMPDTSDPELRLKLIDFGVAKVAAPQYRTMDGSIHGKPAYMSPEQWRGEALDGRTDVYSLGHVAFFALTGRPAFFARNMLEIMEMHLNQPMPAPTRCDPRVAALVLSMCEKKPDSRPNMQFIADQLKAMLR